MTTSERTKPSITAGERDMLEGWLDFHRETLAQKCAGLDDKQLRDLSAPPSELTLLGLVRHMAEVERHWFRRILMNEDIAPLYYGEEDPDGDFHVTADDTWERAHGDWEAEIARARELTAPLSLDERTQGTNSAGEPFNLRWIYVHMIEEYARHNGHADLLRERIDGATGF
ncbi:DinB family protein [Streptomyces sp. NPDC019396]|uniref:DinB family protein n=1 Tax=Streptomyces sp. NPDC019396 TaxID=3154687 RepID=UPI0033FB9B5B